MQAVEDVHVTYEDQQRINNFATNMRRMTELKNELEAKKVSPESPRSWSLGSFQMFTIPVIPEFMSPQKSLQNLQDASDDLMMLDDDALMVPYQIGEVFISHTQEETQELLEAAKVRLHMHLSTFHLPFRALFIYLVWFCASC